MSSVRFRRKTGGPRGSARRDTSTNIGTVVGAGGRMIEAGCAGAVTSVDVESTRSRGSLAVVRACSRSQQHAALASGSSAGPRRSSAAAGQQHVVIAAPVLRQRYHSLAIALVGAIATTRSRMSKGRRTSTQG